MTIRRVTSPHVPEPPPGRWSTGEPRPDQAVGGHDRAAVCEENREQAALPGAADVGRGAVHDDRQRAQRAVLEHRALLVPPNVVVARCRAVATVDHSSGPVEPARRDRRSGSLHTHDASASLEPDADAHAAVQPNCNGLRQRCDRRPGEEELGGPTHEEITDGHDTQP